MEMRFDRNEIRRIALDHWQRMAHAMNEHRILPSRLAALTGHKQETIERGIRGEYVPVHLDLLRALVKECNVVEGRTTLRYDDPIDKLSYESLMEQIGPLPAMPPRQGNFWEWPDD